MSCKNDEQFSTGKEGKELREERKGYERKRERERKRQAQVNGKERERERERCAFLPSFTLLRPLRRGKGESAAGHFPHKERTYGAFALTFGQKDTAIAAESYSIWREIIY